MHASSAQMVWPGRCRARWRSLPRFRFGPPLSTVPRGFGGYWGIDEALAQRLAEHDDPADAMLLAEAAAKRGAAFTPHARTLLAVPPNLARKLIVAFAPARWLRGDDWRAPEWDQLEVFRYLAAEHELLFFDALLAFATEHPHDGLAYLLPYRSPRVAEVIARAMIDAPLCVAGAQWMRAHPSAASAGLLTLAEGAGEVARAARRGLRWLGASTDGPAERAPLGPREGSDAHELPPLVGSSGPLSPAQMEEVIEALRASSIDEAAPALAECIEGTTAASRSALVLALARSLSQPATEGWTVWRDPIGAAPQAWILAALAHLGDAAAIDAFCETIAKTSWDARAPLLVAALSAMDTPFALAHLVAMAEQRRSPRVAAVAREHLAQRADADPDGPSVDGWIESRDASGIEAWSSSQRAFVLATHAARYESAMCERRRWSVSEVKRLARHPLFGALATSLVWATYDSTGVRPFRLTERGAAETSTRGALSLAEDAVVGIVHPIEISDAERALFAESFGEEKIVQPMPQLGRAFHRVAGALAVNRWNGCSTSTERLRSLSGWVLGPPQDGDYYGWLEKVVDGELVCLDVTPGIEMDDTTRRHALAALRVSGAGLSALHAVMLSELVQQIDGLFFEGGDA